jgi:hypothetical protein
VSLYVDADGDGFGATGTQRDGCEEELADGVRGAGDCDDSDITVHPGAAELWYDGVDSDCLGPDTNADGVLDDCDQDLDGWPFVPSPGTPLDPHLGARTLEAMRARCGLAPDDTEHPLDCADTRAALSPRLDMRERPYTCTDDNCLIRPGDLDGDGDGHWTRG